MHMLPCQCKIVILLHQALRVLLELVHGVLGPPVLQVPLPPILPPVIIKSMCQLMTDGKPNTPKVHHLIKKTELESHIYVLH